MRTLTAILIDPFACEVRQIELPCGDDLAAYYAALSHQSHPVDCFDAARAHLLRGRDVIFVDDNGMLQPRERFFFHVGYHSPLAGKGLIVGASASGAAKSADTHIDDVRRCVIFLQRHGNRLQQTCTPWEAPQ